MKKNVYDAFKNSTTNVKRICSANMLFIELNKIH